MQTPKEEIKQRILEAARKEFLKNGFEKASIRVITTNAKTSKSNLYNYFEDKDALFCAVVEPTIAEMNEGFREIRIRNKHANTYVLDAQKGVIYGFVKFAYNHIEDMKLLFYGSSGSSLSAFKNHLIDKIAEALGEWVKQIASGKHFSKLFLRSVAGFYISGMEQLMLEGETEEQAADHYSEFLTFIYGGWKSALENNP